MCDASRILIADDQPDLLHALKLLLKAEDGLEVETAASPEAVLAAVQSNRFDLLLMDLNYTGDTTSGREGIDLLSRVQELDGLLPVVAMTGWGSVDLAVEAMRRGVRDFVQKPWDNRQLVAMLRHEIEEGRARRRRRETEAREMVDARRIQRRLLPEELPQVDGFELAALWQSASGVGGDCYDAIPLASGRLALTIADVVGKGIPAALLMSNLQASVRAFALDAADPATVCAQVNHILSGHIAEGRFISFFYCVLDAPTRTLSYANAGHHPPMLVRADGAIERLDSGGPVLGVFPNATYEQAQVVLGPGDRLVLFTDGIIEARSEADEEFGDERLLAAAVEQHRQPAAGVLRHLHEAAAAFAAGHFQDDATLIVLAVDGD
ncbi:MAG TPA: SpoIIE family protein phosphatase [Vicinamibacterales bacterium]|nr:SpoIIE family protein phosphatase [Vicinamibacterales bacterium]